MKSRSIINSNLSLSIFAIFSLSSFFISSCEKFFKPEEFYLSNIDSKEKLYEAIEGINDNFKYEINSYDVDFLGDDKYVHVSNSEPKQSVNCYMSYYDNLGAKYIKGGDKGLSIIWDWTMNYSHIASINNVLCQFDLKDVKDKNTRELFGECFFYRAWCYYRLTRIYGRIPLIDNPDVNYTVPRSSYSEIYEFIEKDLLKAIDLLPPNNNVSRIPYETPNQGLVKAVLGEVYLSWAGFPVNDKSKYILSAKITEELIDSADYYGYELLPDFEDLWNKKSYYNNEAIFCIYSRLPELKYSTIYMGTMLPLPTYYSIGIGVDRNTALSLIVNPIPEIEFYNNYPKGYRKDITFFTWIYVFPDTYPHRDTGYFYVEQTAGNCRAAYRKFYIDTLLILPSYEHHYKSYDLKGCPRVYLLRYAQTLLTYAEASARSGNLNEKAYDCINKIRRRANKKDLDSPSPFDLTPGLSPEAFADSVAQERAWELAGEPGHRWFDMVRLGIVEKVFDSRDPYDGGPFEYTDNDNYFFPIPKHDIDLNPNLGE